MAERLGFEEAALQRIGEQFDAMADAFANEAGLPPGGKRYSTDEQLAEWNYSPIADPVTRAETMAHLLGMGVSVEKITDQIYPNRRRLVTTGRTKVEEQIKYAQQMDALHKRKAEEMVAQGPQGPLGIVRGMSQSEPLSGDLTAPGATTSSSALSVDGSPTLGAAPSMAPGIPGISRDIPPGIPGAPSAAPSPLDMPFNPMGG